MRDNGCSVEWDNTTNKETKWIKTTIIPHYEVPVIEAREKNDQPGLDMENIRRSFKYKRL